MFVRIQYEHACSTAPQHHSPTTKQYALNHLRILPERSAPRWARCACRHHQRVAPFVLRPPPSAPRERWVERVSRSTRTSFEHADPTPEGGVDGVMEGEGATSSDSPQIGSGGRRAPPTPVARVCAARCTSCSHLAAPRVAILISPLTSRLVCTPHDWCAHPTAGVGVCGQRTRRNPSRASALFDARPSDESRERGGAHAGRSEDRELRPVEMGRDPLRAVEMGRVERGPGVRRHERE